MKVNKYDESKHAPIASIRLERTEFATNGVKKRQGRQKMPNHANLTTVCVCNVKNREAKKGLYHRTISSHGAVRRAWTREPAQQPLLPTGQRLSGCRWATVGRPGAGRSRSPPPASAAPGPRPPPPLLARRTPGGALLLRRGERGRGN